MPRSGSRPEVVLKEHAHWGSWILAAQGELDAGSIGPFRSRAEAAAARFSTLVVDLGAVTFADSSALSLLLRLHRATRLYVAAPRSQLLSLLSMSGADQILRIYPSVDAACAAAAG
ncbi:STAS domain-containing protein [Streptomyces sp. NPDC051214]|uniref:STAS domain-containing protein n=1 Tax=Streptomyces sp. NPDC051214 TaxID=3155282 RepID=UPI00342E0BED